MLHTELIAPLPSLLLQHADRRGDAIAYRDVNRAVSYGDLAQRTANLAGHLSELGVKVGDPVALYLPNSVEWVETCFAINRAGGICVPISYEAAEGEIVYRLQDAACRVIVTTGERLALIEALKAQCPGLGEIIVTDRGGIRDRVRRFEQLAGTPSSVQAPDSADIFGPAFILYTSGTTGRAKGVVLSVHSMLWIAASCWAPILKLSSADTILSPLPLFHSYALNLSVLGVLALGASEYVMEKFSTSEVIKLLKTGEFTFFPGVPTMFHYLLEAAKADPSIRLEGLRLVMSAGAIMPATLNREFEARFGVTLLDGYGITETATMVTMNWPTGTRVPGSCGLPVPGLSVRILDPASGIDVAAGAEGELIVRGPNLMSGYHNKPTETEAALRNGWYHTGDLARSDPNGYLTITGRLKELIIRGGQNIAPAEIEEVVLGCEHVVDCAVIGTPHAHLGEVPALFVVSRVASPDSAIILEHCRKHLSAYKVPVAIHFIDQIPRTGSGKIMRFKLRERLA
ncbi:MAG: AMP-binding protein [Beijerinckiaceae bacterium]